MRKLAPIPLLLLVAVACSSFQNRRVVQANAFIEESAKQVELRMKHNKISSEDAEAIIVGLEYAAAQVDRYWNAIKTGQPRSVVDAIFDALDDALAKIRELLYAKAGETS